MQVSAELLERHKLPLSCGCRSGCGYQWVPLGEPWKSETEIYTISSLIQVHYLMPTQPIPSTVQSWSTWKLKPQTENDWLISAVWSWSTNTRWCANCLIIKNKPPSKGTGIITAVNKHPLQLWNTDSRSSCLGTWIRHHPSMVYVSALYQVSR